ncbi:hypothetical protein [Nostoc sp. TCL240-02]|nr:hypothetical protein [Nostoc sp. TCL240-02]
MIRFKPIATAEFIKTPAPQPPVGVTPTPQPTPESLVSDSEEFTITAT